jgi:hypothetical protein
MKKLVLSAFMVFALGAAHQAQAQAGALVNLIGAGIGLGIRAAAAPKLTPEQKAAQKAAQQAAEAKITTDQQSAELNAAGPAAPATLAMQRTAADKLPKKGAEQITALEAELERCHAAMQASPTGTVCTPEQRAAIQKAAVAVARAQPNWDLHPYQQEMAFYSAEDTRRQATPAAPTK